MVCPRCITSVEQLLKENKLQANFVRLGEVELAKVPGEKSLEQFAVDLKTTGFELLDDSRKQIIEKIKNIIVTQVHHSDEENHHNYSDILSKTLHKDYSYLSGLFSGVEGITIEKFTINQKIEKVKELIIYDELNLSEIAYKLGYSSVAHLSNQFKKVTGLTPSHFKQVGQNKRKSLDNI
jgi:AraC-like DNA-binding protein